MQVSPCENMDASTNQFFDFAGIGASSPHGSRTHVHDETISTSQREQFRAVFAEVSNRGIDMACSLDARPECSPQHLVGEESRSTHR